MLMRQIMQIVEGGVEFPSPSLETLGWQKTSNHYTHPMYKDHRLIPAERGTFKHYHQGDMVGTPINITAAHRSVRNFKAPR